MTQGRCYTVTTKLYHKLDFHECLGQTHWVPPTPQLPTPPPHKTPGSSGAEFNNGKTAYSMCSKQGPYGVKESERQSACLPRIAS